MIKPTKSLATQNVHSEDSDQTGRMSFCWFCCTAAHIEITCCEKEMTTLVVLV